MEGLKSPDWCKCRGARPKNENLWVLTHPAIIIFAVAADAISQALMGLNFTLNSPHCPQQMTNAVSCCASCWRLWQTLSLLFRQPLAPVRGSQPPQMGHAQVGNFWGSLGAPGSGTRV